jgi:hypothetical protein
MMTYVLARDFPHHRRPEETCSDYFRGIHKGLGCVELTSRIDDAMKFATPQGAKLAIGRYGLRFMEPRKI